MLWAAKQTGSFGNRHVSVFSPLLTRCCIPLRPALRRALRHDEEVLLFYTNTLLDAIE